MSKRFSKPKMPPRGRFRAASPPAGAKSREEVSETDVSSAPPGRVARETSILAAEAERAAFVDRKRPEPVVASGIRRLRGFSLADRLFVGRAIESLFRWWGWIEPLRLGPIEARLLIAVLLDQTDVPKPCRAWAHEVGVDPKCLVPIGHAPDWPTRANAFRRLVENPRASTDPWLLFPSWLKSVLPLPPGDSAPKHRLTALLHDLQSVPLLWVRAVRGDAGAIWEELRSLGLEPHVHPQLSHAASLAPETLLQSLEPFRRGDLVAEDLASQVIVAVCDAEPGDRWWVAGSDRGELAVHLADRMGGKGVVVSAELEARDRRRTVRLARSGSRSNIAVRPWDGRHVVGKAGRYHGVLLEPPCSGIGAWRRDPAARWFVDRADLDRFAEEQARLLRIAAQGVRPDGGVLVYAVRTLSPQETTEQVDHFLAEHPEFRPDPFPDPIDGSTPTDGSMRLWPGRADSEGAYVARLIRSGRPGPEQISSHSMTETE